MWLLEAATETYLPVLRVLRRVQADGITLKANSNISPIQLEQLAHPVFKAEVPEYLNRKIAASEVDEEHFKAAGGRAPGRDRALLADLLHQAGWRTRTRSARTSSRAFANSTTQT